MHRELFEPLQLGQTSVTSAPRPGAAVRYSADDSPLPFCQQAQRSRCAARAACGGCGDPGIRLAPAPSAPVAAR
jgi:hypothetical protein